MSDPRVMELLEDILDSGRTPEEACAGCPELLCAVHERLRGCYGVDAELDAMFPPSGATPAGEDTAGVDAAAELPEVPGYDVESVIGRGGMGVVYKARDLALNRPVALKMILSGAYAGRDELSRFKREAEAVANLQHAHIVQVHHIGEVGGRPYFTMEFVGGGSLAQKLAGAPLPAAQAAELAAILAGAVQAAHAGGIVHRDLKPANILLRADSTPMIADFGLARHLEGEEAGAVTLAGARVGTPSYMAPEQAEGGRGTAGPATDVYALGAILYELLTGRPPFRGETASQTLRQVVEQEPVPPSRMNPRVPRDLETVCLKCLAKDPGKRYASAAALAEDLGRFLRGEPVVARRTGRLARCAKWVRRRPAAAALWAGGALVALAVCGGAMWYALDRAAAAREIADELALGEQRQREARWVEANAALDRAELRLGNRRLGDLPARLHRARRDAALVARLDEIRMDLVKFSNSGFTDTADAAYEAALRAAGFFDDGADPSAVAARIRASNVNPAVANAIYDWLRRPAWVMYGRVDWLRALARQADASPDPTGWRRRVLDSATWGDPAALEALAVDPAAAGQSPELLMFLGLRLDIARRDSLPLMLRVHQAHPDHYRINFELGRTQRERKNLPDALRYGQAAIALRPQAAAAHADLGRTLHEAGRYDDAAAAFREALRIESDYATNRLGLARALAAAGAYEQAAAQFERLIHEGHDIEGTVVEFAHCLEQMGRLEEAAGQYRQLIEVWRKAAVRNPEAAGGKYGRETMSQNYSGCCGRCSYGRGGGRRRWTTPLRRRLHDDLVCSST
jgi:serine/threonine-protein kinase